MRQFADADKIFRHRDNTARRVMEETNEDLETTITDAKYGFIHGALKEANYYTGTKEDTYRMTHLLDHILTHRVIGFPILDVYKRQIKGKVVVIADYGAFVEVQPGVEGLIHVSEMSWSQHLRSAQEFLHVGDEVEAVILTLDRQERKMSLGIKQLKDDPWETIETKYPVGSKHTAKVRNFTNFGIFVELEEGVDGLIHISDLSWTKKVKHPSDFTSVGAEIEVVVLEIDKENRRLSLGHKQLEDNPWDTYETIYTPGSIHQGKITELMDKGAVITLNEGGEGFATPKHLTKEAVSYTHLCLKNIG